MAIFSKILQLIQLKSLKEVQSIFMAKVQIKYQSKIIYSNIAKAGWEELIIGIIIDQYTKVVTFFSIIKHILATETTHPHILQKLNILINKS